MTKPQDFSKKITIVVRRDLENWQVLNTVGHIAAYFGNQLKDEFDTGEYFVTKDGVNHPRNSQYPIVVLSADAAKLYPLVQVVRAQGLSTINFIRDMIETTDDSELEQRVGTQDDKDLDYLGVGIFGDKDVLKELTKQFKLWK
jgi:hypothetical protein